MKNVHVFLNTSYSNQDLKISTLYLYIGVLLFYEGGASTHFMKATTVYSLNRSSLML